MRKPDIEIGGDYLHRWYVIPRNRFFNIYLHKFMRSDDDRALHDHPWFSLSFLLKGEIIEHSFKGVRHISRFIPAFRSAKFAHRLELVKGPVWTLFITGPRVREWGFYCPKGWRHWTLFTSPDGKSIGAGCGEIVSENWSQQVLETVNKTLNQEKSVLGGKAQNKRGGMFSN